MVAGGRHRAAFLTHSLARWRDLFSIAINASPIDRWNWNGNDRPPPPACASLAIPTALSNETCQRLIQSSCHRDMIRRHH